MQINFTGKHDDDAGISNWGEHDSWRDIADMFYDFLLGCGFSLTRDHLSDHFLSPEYARSLQEKSEEERSGNQDREDKEQEAKDKAEKAWPKCNCNTCRLGLET